MSSHLENPPKLMMSKRIGGIGGHAFIALHISSLRIIKEFQRSLDVVIIDIVDVPCLGLTFSRRTLVQAFAQLSKATLILFDRLSFGQMK
jgi:hypothetical protein